MPVVSSLDRAISTSLAGFFGSCSSVQLKALLDGAFQAIVEATEQAEHGADQYINTSSGPSLIPDSLLVDKVRCRVIWPDSSVIQGHDCLWQLLSACLSCATVASGKQDAASKATKVRSLVTACLAKKFGQCHWKIDDKLGVSEETVQHQLLENGSVKNTASMELRPYWYSLSNGHSVVSDSEYQSKIPNATVINQSPRDGKVADGLKSTLILPCAGRSSRFPGFKPKWTLTMPNGRLMFVDSISKLNLSNVKRIVIGVLREHVDQHCGGDAENLFRCLDDCPTDLSAKELTIVVIGQPTIDQVQTIQCIVQHAQIQGPIFLKDCDNQFECTVPTSNAIATLQITKDMEHLDVPAGKSYAEFDPTGHLTNIVEKVMLGPTFCVGGYSFASSDEFLLAAKEVRKIQRDYDCSSSEVAISDLVWYQTVLGELQMSKLSDSVRFENLKVSSYQDWGTLIAWQKYCSTFRTLFVDIDGTLVKNSGAYFKPNWGMKEPLEQNVKYLKDLHKQGRTQIVLTTSRTEAYRQVTEEQLAEAGISYDSIVFGLLHAKRVLINDFAKTNPFPSASSINLRRDSDNLSELLGNF